MAGEILQSTDRAASLSRELLDFSRQDSGADLGPVNLRTETEAAMEVIKRLTPKKIDFSAEIMSQDISGSVDADLQWYVNNRIIDRIIMKDKLLEELDKLG